MSLWNKFSGCPCIDNAIPLPPVIPPSSSLLLTDLHAGSKLRQRQLHLQLTNPISSLCLSLFLAEIRGVAGEPNYKSVNLTWEVEFVTSAHDTDTQQNANGVGDAPAAPASPASASAAAAADGVTNMNTVNAQLEPPKAFQIFYCEMQNYGPQRCRVKLVNGTAAQLPEAEEEFE